MTKFIKQPEVNNPFKKLLDDASRSLATEISDPGYLDDLPIMSDESSASIPFPYGAQPESRHGWK